MSRDACLIPRTAAAFRFDIDLSHILSSQAHIDRNGLPVLAWARRLHLGRITSYSLRSVRVIRGGRK